MGRAIEILALSCMESENPGVVGYHQLAGRHAKEGAAAEHPSAKTYHRTEEARALLGAVANTHPTLSTATMLRVAASIAERANA